MLAKVARRHVVLTIPRLLRPLLRRRRELLTELGRAAAGAVNELGRAFPLAGPMTRQHVPPVAAADRIPYPLGQRMSLIAFVTDQMAIGRILDHLGLNTPEAAKPPPPARELLRVAEQGDGWGVPAEWE